MRTLILYRYGTAFSFLAQITLSASVWTTYTQWLWRTVRRRELEVPLLNYMFGADTSILPLLHWKMLSEFRIGSIMALFAWYVYGAPLKDPPSKKIAGVFYYHLSSHQLPSSSIQALQLRMLMKPCHIHRSLTANSDITMPIRLRSSAAPCSIRTIQAERSQDHGQS